MDPDAALEHLRELCDDFDHATDPIEQGQIASELVDTFQGLDGWLSRSGFPPKPWQRGEARPDVGVGR